MATKVRIVGSIKGRKGEQIYVKKDGEKGRYYTYDPRIPVEDYIRIHNTESIKGRTLVAAAKARALKRAHKADAERRQLNKKIKKASRKTNLGKLLTPGSNELTFDLDKVAPWNVATIERRLITPLVKDTRNISMVATQASRMKHRYSYLIHATDASGNTVYTMEDIGRRTLREAITDFKGIPKGTLSYNSVNKTAGTLNIPTSSVTIAQPTGTVDKITLTVRFTRGQTRL